jgi:hypothetical protein
MSLNNLSDRSYETTKLLRRCQGVFSKARRTLTSPPQFRIAWLSGPEGFPTAALDERRIPGKQTLSRKLSGTVTPAHNRINRNSDAGKTNICDWKPSPNFNKGTEPCNRHANDDKRFLPDGANMAYPMIRYISDRRPRGLSPQQLAAVFHRIPVRGTITLLRILNGTAGYRTDSEDSLKSPGRYCRMRTYKSAKTVCDNDAMIPDICLERRSISASAL